MIVYNGESIRGGSFEIQSLELGDRKASKTRIFMRRLKDILCSLFQGEQRYVEIVKVVENEDRILNLNPELFAYAIYVYVEIVEPEARKAQKFELTKEIVDSCMELLKKREKEDKKNKEGFKITIIRYLRFLLNIYERRKNLGIQQNQ
jgi:hypothetical protein